MFPTYTQADLSEFSGRPAASYTSYATQAIKQATLFFKRSTCLTGLPADADSAELAKFAILQLADYFVLSQPFQKTLASPFSSEAIGSYSYSKMVNSINRREKTNLMFFDMAVEDLGQCDFMGGMSTMGGIEAFEHDEPVVEGSFGNKRLLGPSDLGREEFIMHDPSVSGDGFDGIYDGGEP